MHHKQKTPTTDRAWWQNCELKKGQESPLCVDTIRPLAPDWLERGWGDTERFDPRDSESRWASHGEGLCLLVHIPQLWSHCWVLRRMFSQYGLPNLLTLLGNREVHCDNNKSFKTSLTSGGQRTIHNRGVLIQSNLWVMRLRFTVSP